MHGTAAQGVLTRQEAIARPCTRLYYGLAAPSDDEALRRLMRENVMPGRVSLGLEYEPSFFHALSIEGYHSQSIVARDAESGHIVAMGTRSVRQLYVNGCVTSVGYLAHLRVDARHRRRSRLRKNGYALARTLRAKDETPFDMTCVLADNQQARRLLTAGVAGVPKYVACDRIVTLAISTHRRVRAERSSAIEIQAGSAIRLGEIADCLDRSNRRFQFASRWTVDDLLSTKRSRGLQPEDFHVAVASGRVVGTAARWDQRSFKQLVVRDYVPALRRWRPLINCLAPLTKQPRLPAIGQPINSVFLSHFAVDGDDPAIALMLVESARREARERGIEILLMGLSVHHPLLRAIRRATSHRTCESVLYLVNWANAADLVEGLDGRVAHPEIATL